MLVLSRKRHEQIQIGDNITLTILKIKGNSVSVGIEAPRNVRVLRSELPQHQPIPDPHSVDQLEPEELEPEAVADRPVEGLHRLVRRVTETRVTETRTNNERVGVAV